MNISGSGRTGVLIVRLWIEAGHEVGLRARITQMLDTAGEQSIAVAASADDICAVVNQWVEAFVGPGAAIGNGLVTPGSDDDRT